LWGQPYRRPTGYNFELAGRGAERSHETLLLTRMSS
jgi:hypothetical protein